MWYMAMNDGVCHAFQAENDSRHNHKYNFHLFSISNLFHTHTHMLAGVLVAISNGIRARDPFSLLFHYLVQFFVPVAHSCRSSRSFSSRPFLATLARVSILMVCHHRLCQHWSHCMLTFSFGGFYPHERLVIAHFTSSPPLFSSRIS